MWRNDSEVFEHPKHGRFFLTLYKDGTASSCRIWRAKGGDNIETIVGSTERPFKTVAEVRAIVAQRIMDLDKA